MLGTQRTSRRLMATPLYSSSTVEPPAARPQLQRRDLEPASPRWRSIGHRRLDPPATPVEAIEPVLSVGDLGDQPRAHARESEPGHRTQHPVQLSEGPTKVGDRAHSERAEVHRPMRHQAGGPAGQAHELDLGWRCAERFALAAAHSGWIDRVHPGDLHRVEGHVQVPDPKPISTTEPCSPRPLHDGLWNPRSHTTR